jgi:hypothetical protein
MRGTMPMALLLIVLAAAQAAPAAEPATLRVSVDPTVMQAPGRVQVRVRHTPTALDRALAVEIEGPSFFRRSWQQLEGDRAAALHTFSLRDLPSGDYMVRVAVERSGEADATEEAVFRVITTDIPTIVLP